MRIFVGTLKTIENEFEECRVAIRRQSHRDFEHFVFEGLPNKQAHDILYRSFMERADEFDLLVKVDADMVIEDRHLFAKIVRRFEENPTLKDLEIAVHDFFSDRLVWGMHAYRNTVEWSVSEENLFVDACPVAPHEHVHDATDLAPAAVHCKNPTPFQAFHFGVQRALKVTQPGRTRKDPAHVRYHWSVMERTRKRFLETRDPRRGFAVLGAKLGYQGRFLPSHLDYSDPYLRERFEEYADLDAEGLLGALRHYSTSGLLPGRLRRGMVVWRSRLSR